MKRVIITILIFLFGIGCGFGAFFMLKTGGNMKKEELKSVQRLEVPETDFNSHPHEEDDSPSSRQYQLREHFNSHPHEEDDISPTSGSFAKIPFQLTSSRRG